MKLWLLKPLTRTGLFLKSDTLQGVVVCAESEAAARTLAAAQAGDEAGQTSNPLPNPWLNPEQTSCQELIPDEEPGVILRDFLNG